MKKFLWIFAIALLGSTVIFTSGCTEDDPGGGGGGGGGVDLAPLLVITNSPVDTVQDQDATVTFTVEVTKGTEVLNSMTITEDGIKVDASRLTIAGIATANNPQLITGTDTEGLTWDITLNVQDAYDTRTYEVSVEDKGGKSDSETFDITVVEPVVTTPLDIEISGVLFNQAGPAGKGAIDLDSGNTTGISSADPVTGTQPEDAELRDMGIDSSIDPAVAENWRGQIAGVNNSIVRKINTPSAENFTFDVVTTKEQIAAEWDAADSLPNTELVGGVMTGVSDPVVAGDMFIVEDQNLRLFLIRVDEVNPVMGSNGDNYVISIKQ
ncbi:MAG TPA: hypothetical protein ENJ95_20675 [Bacteroidetes bacterium]|nr:hypothetical protein [Bacteroidota bacterium]